MITSRVGEATPSYEPVQETKPVEEREIIRGIKVLYGDHYYGSANQAEYDKVVNFIKDKLPEMTNISFGDRYEQQYYDFLAGKCWDKDRSNRITENKGLSNAESAVGILVEDGVPDNSIIEMYKASELASDIPWCTVVVGVRLTVGFAIP